jgi:hypothetical protein
MPQSDAFTPTRAEDIFIASRGGAMIRRIVFVCAFALPMLGACGDGGSTVDVTPTQQVTTQDLPPPRNPVQTIGGRTIDRSCIHAVPNNATLANPTGGGGATTVSVNGQVIATYPACPFKITAEDPTSPTTNSAYVEWTNLNADPNYYFSAIDNQITVPPAPIDKTFPQLPNLKTIVAFWNGFQPMPNTYDQIIQPALVFGQFETASSQQCGLFEDWSIFSFYANASGGFCTQTSQPVAVWS